jgi:small subunit ribosomal protein S8
MSMTDPIADFLSRIRNGIMARHTEVVAPASKIKEKLCELLKDEGYIAGHDTREVGGFPEIVVRLQWADPRTNAITGLRRRSRPHVRAPRQHPQDPLGSGHRHPVDVERSHDRSRGAEGGPGRRASLRSLVVDAW